MATTNDTETAAEVFLRNVCALMDTRGVKADERLWVEALLSEATAAEARRTPRPAEQLEVFIRKRASRHFSQCFEESAQEAIHLGWSRDVVAFASLWLQVMHETLVDRRRAWAQSKGGGS